MANIRSLAESIARGLSDSTLPGARRAAGKLFSLSAPPRNLARDMYNKIFSSSGFLRWDSGPSAVMMDNIDHFAPSAFRVFDDNGKLTHLGRMFSKEYDTIMRTGNMIESDSKLIPSEFQAEASSIKRLQGVGPLGDINIIRDERGISSSNPYKSIRMVAPKSRIASKILEMTETITTVSGVHESQDWNTINRMFSTLYGRDAGYLITRNDRMVLNRSLSNFLRKRWAIAYEEGGPDKVVEEASKLKLSPSNVEKLRQFSILWKELTDKHLKRAIDAKVTVDGKPIENFAVEWYVPHKFHPKFMLGLLRGEGPEFEYMMSQFPHIVGKWSARDMYRFAEDIDMVHRYGSLEHRRFYRIPQDMRELDPFRLLPRMVSFGNRRMQVIHHIGQGKMSTFTNEIAKVLGSGKAAQAFAEMWDSVQMMPVNPPKSITQVSAIQGLNLLANVGRFVQLQHSAVANILGYTPAMSRGFVRFVKGYAKSFDKNTMDELRLMGGWANNTLLGSYDAPVGLGETVTSMLLRATQFERINRHINKVTGYVYLDEFETRIGKLIKNRNKVVDAYNNGGFRAVEKLYGEDVRALIKDLGMTEDAVMDMVATGTIDEAYKARAVQIGVARANLFRERPADVHRGLHNQYIKPFLAYTGFLRNMQHHMVRAMEEISSGNFKPLARLIIGAAATDKVATAVKDFINDRESNTDINFLRDLGVKSGEISPYAEAVLEGMYNAGLFGIGNYALDIFRYSAGPNRTIGGFLTSALTPPAASAAADFGTALYYGDVPGLTIQIMGVPRTIYRKFFESDIAKDFRHVRDKYNKWKADKGDVPIYPMYSPTERTVQYKAIHSMILNGDIDAAVDTAYDFVYDMVNKGKFDDIDQARESLMVSLAERGPIPSSRIMEYTSEIPDDEKARALNVYSRYQENLRDFITKYDERFH